MPTFALMDEMWTIEPAARLDHRGDGLPSAEELPLQVHVDDPLPRFVGDVGDVPVVERPARVVHEDVDAPVTLHRCLDHRGDVGGLAHVGSDELGRTSTFLDAGDGFLSAVLVHVRDDDGGSRVRESFRNGSTDTLRRPGDDGDVAVSLCTESHISHLSSGYKRFWVHTLDSH